MIVDVFSGTAIVVASAAILVWIAGRTRQSAVVAYLLLGVLFGPQGLHFVAGSADVDRFADVGVIFLLFFIGLDFNVDALRRTAPLVFGGTPLQLAAAAVPVALAAVAFGVGGKEALLLGVCAGLSSTAILMKAFVDRGESDTPAAQSSLVVSIAQDIYALLAVAVLPLLVGKAGEGDAASDLVIMAVALPTLYFIARKLFPFVFRRAAVAKSQEAFALCSLGACLLVAFGARELKASPGLGAFLGGLVFAGTPYAHQIRADLASMKNLALGFFFFTVGMLLDLSFLGANLPLVLGSLAGLIVVKTAGAALVFRLFGTPWSIACAAGLALGQISEFAFVLAAEGSRLGLLSEDRRQLLFAVAVLSMLVGPALVSRANAFGRRAARLLRGDVRSPAPRPASPSHGDADSAAPATPTVRAVVVGYGPVGKVLCKILIRFGVSPCVVDLHLDTVKRLHAIGREAVYGDAGKREVLEAAGVLGARYLLITLPDLASRAPIITSARSLNPDITILSRARYLTERQSLESSGADHISYEEAEVAAELARLLLGRLGVGEDLLLDEVKRLRGEIAVRSGFTRVMRRPGMTAPQPVQGTPSEDAPSVARDVAPTSEGGDATKPS